MVRLWRRYPDFLADRTNARAIGTVLRPSVCRRRLSSVTLCIVAKRCVLEQKLLVLCATSRLLD